LFRELQERFSGFTPPEDGVRTYLNRQNFNESAIRPATKAFLDTLSYLEEQGVTESNGVETSNAAESKLSEGENAFGGARVGDFVQWESQGELRLSKPLRVRLVSEDGQWVVVEGSETGIPMKEVIVQTKGSMPEPPIFPLPKAPMETDDMEEWFRAKVGADKLIVVHYKGADSIGPKEVQKLIDLLTAQKTALED
jgi:hypothetical protein